MMLFFTSDKIQFVRHALRRRQDTTDKNFVASAAPAELRRRLPDRSAA